MKSRFMSNDEKTEIISLHEKGFNTVEIGKKIGRSQSTIERYLKSKGYTMNYGRRINGVELDNIIELYNNGLTCREIHKLYSHIYNSEEAIQRIIKKAGISRGRHKKEIILEHDYFENIDTENKAYFLGLLLADGCIIDSHSGQSIIKLELKYEDKYIIESLANELKTDLIVRDYNYGRKHNAILQVRSDKMAKDLSYYGIIPRKSLIISDIPNISDEMIRHFLRGFFDGNGSLYVYKPKDQTVHRMVMTFCSTEMFLNNLNSLLSKKLDIDIKKIINMNKYGCNVYNLRYNKNEELLKLYHLLYDDSNIFLKRKKEKFDKYINERY